MAASIDGTVFELAKGSGTITTLASFNGSNGEYPYAGLIRDSSGNLYGTAYQGGASGDGTVFELARAAARSPRWPHSTAPTADTPKSALIMDSSGNLYGTTYEGGASTGDGTVFELAKGSGTITTLASFNGDNGQYPDAALIMDSSGNLYGTTCRRGRPRRGQRFRAGEGSSAITTLASFNGTNGAIPRRTDHGQQWRSLWHNRVWGLPRKTAAFSRCYHTRPS